MHHGKQVALIELEGIALGLGPELEDSESDSESEGFPWPTQARRALNLRPDGRPPGPYVVKSATFKLFKFSFRAAASLSERLGLRWGCLVPITGTTRRTTDDMILQLSLRLRLREA